MDPWTQAMLRGDFEAAWRVCDRVLEQRRGVDCSTTPRHLQPVWDGSALEGRHVLVHCYHGLGDTIQFVRLLAPLRQRASRTTLWVQPALARLLQGVRGLDAIESLHDGAPHFDYDVDLELMELPHALRLSAAGIPAHVPYIHVPYIYVCSPRHGRPRPRAVRVGLVWRAGDWRAERSIADASLEPFAAISGVEWRSLQYPPQPSPFPMADLACRDLCELAARMQTLDLVISLDTMTAHLAGALGLPVWTLLSADCDWRWMAGRGDTPWYPTMRLFRQHRPGDWTAPVAAAAQRLLAWVRSYSSARYSFRRL
jgi:hypothetical protein